MNYTTKRKSYLSSAGAAKSDQILKEIQDRKVDKQQAALNSAALQDHIMKSYNLNMMDPYRKLPPRQPKVAKNSGFQMNAREILASHNIVVP